MKVRYKIVFHLFFLLLLLSVPPVYSYNVNLTYTNISGEIVDYKKYSGKPLLIETFATWAGTSRSKTQEIFIVENKTRSVLNVLSLSVSNETDTIDIVREYQSSFNAKWDFGIDHAAAFLELFDIVFIPTIFLFDSDGNVLHTWEGFTESDIILLEIESILDLVLESENTTPESVSVSSDVELGDFYHPLISFGSIILISIFKVKNKK